MAPEPAPLRAVVFDLAGTLVDYGSCAPAAVFLEVFRRNGVEITMAQARGPMGVHKRDHVAAITRMSAVAAAWKQAHGGECTDRDVESMYRELIPLQLACLPDYSQLIPGALDAVAECRRRGLKVAATTGYNREMTDVVLGEMQHQGLEPDAAVCVDDVPAGRPEPWMALLAAMRLRAYPVSACVKVGDTLPDIAEGRNAGMWAVAVAGTGNELGLSLREAQSLPANELAERLQAARGRLAAARAHFVIDGVADLPPVLDEIAARLSRGERP